MPLPPEEPIRVPDWFVTYADLMGLLMVFFVMLISVGEGRDQRRVDAAMDTIQKKFGRRSLDASAASASCLARAVAQHSAAGRQRFGEALCRGERRVPATSPRPAEAEPAAVASGQRLFAVTFPQRGSHLTTSQQASLEPAVRRVLQATAALEVRGKVAPGNKDVPGEDAATGPPGSGWDLTFARCQSVLDFLMEEGIDPARLRVVVSSPAHGDDSLRSADRRAAAVEVFVTR